jgi:hypothetical protein
LAPKLHKSRKSWHVDFMPSIPQLKDSGIHDLTNAKGIVVAND